MKFTMDELSILAIYKAKTPDMSIRKINEALPYVDDSDMVTLMSVAKSKLEKLTENEYKKLNLESFVLECDNDDPCD